MSCTLNNEAQTSSIMNSSDCGGSALVEDILGILANHSTNNHQLRDLLTSFCATHNDINISVMHLQVQQQPQHPKTHFPNNVPSPNKVDKAVQAQDQYGMLESKSQMTLTCMVGVAMPNLEMNNPQEMTGNHQVNTIETKQHMEQMKENHLRDTQKMVMHAHEAMGAVKTEMLNKQEQKKPLVKAGVMKEQINRQEEELKKPKVLERQYEVQTEEVMKMEAAQAWPVDQLNHVKHLVEMQKKEEKKQEGKLPCNSSTIVHQDKEEELKKPEELERHYQMGKKEQMNREEEELKKPEELERHYQMGKKEQMNREEEELKKPEELERHYQMGMKEQMNREEEELKKPEELERQFQMGKKEQMNREEEELKKPEELERQYQMGKKEQMNREEEELKKPEELERQYEVQTDKENIHRLFVGYGVDTSSDESERYYVGVHKSGSLMYIILPQQDDFKKVFYFLCPIEISTIK